MTVLVSPSNFHNLNAMYSQIPGVRVQALRLRSRDLTISNMLTLMSVDSSTNPPLYMSQVTRVLREMATLGGEFEYIDFINRLAQVDLNLGQRRMLDQRLELLESFLDLESWQGGCFDRVALAQELTIVDLSCPFVDASAACVLFNICIGLFLSASSPESIGKVIAVDEAHKVCILWFIGIMSVCHQHVKFFILRVSVHQADTLWFYIVYDRYTRGQMLDRATPKHYTPTTPLWCSRHHRYSRADNITTAHGPRIRDYNSPLQQPRVVQYAA